jgi:hypothetical protein
MSFTHYVALYQLVSRYGLGPTFSGWATIMWQSMNIPGTPFEMDKMTGGPLEHDEK